MFQNKFLLGEEKVMCLKKGQMGSYPRRDLEFMKRPINSRWGGVNIELNYTIEDPS